MKLLLKHIVRSILKAPLQPLLILLTVVLSVATTVTSLRMQSVIVDHAETKASVGTELGDVVIGIGPKARLRVLFERDAERVVGEDGAVLGEFSFTAFYDNGQANRAVYASGIDLLRAEEYFNFSYVSGDVNENKNLRTSAVLSKAFAEKNGLSVGDKLVLNVLGETKELTVQAIAKKTGILSEKDLLVSEDVLSNVLKKWIPVFSIFPNTVKIQNRLMIDVYDDAKIADVSARLNESRTFADQAVTETYHTNSRDFTVYIQTMAITVMMVLVILLTVILLSTCMLLMQRQRGAEYAQFCSVGAPRSVLWRMQTMEAMLYAVIGSIGGVLLAPWMIERASSAFEWVEEPVLMRGRDAMVGVMLAVLLMLLCTLVTLFSQRKYSLAEWLNLSGDRQKKGSHPIVASVMAGVSGILIAATYLIDSRYRAPIGFASAFSIVVFLYFFVPIVVGNVMHFVEFLLEKRSRNGCFLLAVKNLRHHVSLLHVARLVTLLLSVLLVITVCSSQMEKQTNSMRGTLTSDLVGVNVPEKLRNEIEAMPQVKSTACVKYFPDVIVEGYNVIAGLSLSGEAQDCVSKDFCPKKLPTGNEAVLSEGIAAILDAKVGDVFTMEIRGEKNQFVLSEILPTALSSIYFNAADMGFLQNELYCITFHDEYRNQETLEKLSATLETSGAILVDREALFDSMPQTLSGFLFLLQASVSISTVLAVIGGVNVLYSQYRARREERALLRMMGMTRAKMLVMHVWELLLLATLSLLLAVIFGAGICMIVDTIARSFGIVMFL